MLNRLNDRLINNLISALTSVNDEEQCASFLEDLCTPGEIKAMAQRLEVAKLLDAGLVYSEIAQKTGCSAAVISRVKRALDYGRGGYRSIIDKLDGEH